MNKNIELYNIIIKYEKNGLYIIQINLYINNSFELHNILRKYG